MTIPRTVHYCWFGGQPKPALVRRCLESWSRVLPAYEVTEWNESNVPSDLPYLSEALEKGLWSKASNLVRLQVLAEHGGVYLDTDIELVRPFLDLHENDCVLGFQQTENTSDWVNNAVILSSAFHPFLDECIELTLDHHRRTGQFLRSPQVTTTVLKNRGLVYYGDQVVGDVRIVPVDFFYPRSWEDELRDADLTPNTYCIHHWHHSWDEPGELPSWWEHFRREGLKRLIPERLRTSRPFLEVGLRRAIRQASRRTKHPSSTAGVDPFDLVLSTSGGIVKSGAFQGMKCLPYRDIPHLTAKLLGTFERELAPWWNVLFRRDYAEVIDVGCGEGYHAVGLARSLPGVTVRAVDDTPRNLSLTRRMSSLNGVADRVKLQNRNSLPTLFDHPSPRSIVLTRAGPEDEWITEPSGARSMQGRDAILELVERPGDVHLSEALQAHFEESHELTWTSYQGRRSDDCPIEHPALSSAARLDMVEEFRDGRTRWALLLARD